jgi:hypothetical protein
LLPELSNRYEEAKTKGMDNYDRELEETIERLIVECERKIKRALQRLEEEDAKAAIAISITEVTKVPPTNYSFGPVNTMYDYFIVETKW